MTGTMSKLSFLYKCKSQIIWLAYRRSHDFENLFLKRGIYSVHKTKLELFELDFKLPTVV